MAQESWRIWQSRAAREAVNRARAAGAAKQPKGAAGKAMKEAVQRGTGKGKAQQN